MPGYLPNLWPGIHGPEHHADFLAGGAATRFGSPGCRLCIGRTKAGADCRAPAVRGEDRCRTHLGRARQARSPARIAANRQRAAWKLDPWAPGATLALSRDQASAMYWALVEAGHKPGRMAPAVLDWATWKWRRAFLDKVERPQVWTEALAALPKRMQAAGPMPAGWKPWATVPPAYTVPDAGGASGVGRAKHVRPRVELGRSEESVFPPGPLPGLSKEDYFRATMALAEHGRGALASALASVVSDAARLHVAMAFAKAEAGELGPWGWTDAMAALRGR